MPTYTDWSNEELAQEWRSLRRRVAIVPQLDEDREDCYQEMMRIESLAQARHFELPDS